MERYKIFLLVTTNILCFQNAFAALSCPNGYTAVANVNAGSFAPATDKACDVLSGGYVKITVPDEDLEFIFNGFTSGSTVTFKTFSQGTCNSGDIDLNVNASTFMAPVPNGNSGTLCNTAGYVKISNFDNDFHPKYDGFLNGSAITLCGDGRWSGTTCVPVTSGDCPESADYYNLGLNVNSFANTTNGACTSPYVKFTNTTRCDHNAGDTCVDLPTPNINITWVYNDGTGATSSSQCYLEEVIELPPTPTRPGYVFGGWKVKKD